MADCISYKSIPYYSDLILDYLDKKPNLQNFYHRFPSLENLKAQFNEKGAQYSDSSRQVLVKALKNQYSSVEASKLTQKNIESLKQNNTFTITTGHQLNLFTGPLYYFYKIISVINLTKELKQKYPDCNFVPIFWMASEDHDFEEINFFNLKERQVWWESKQTGAVGEFLTKDFKSTYEAFSESLNESDYADELRKLFKKAYLEHETLTEATRFLGNEFFKDYGLVIVDGNDADLKQLFSPYVKDELLKQTAYQKVGEKAQKLKDAGYHIQVNPREINLFYLKEGIRERIIKEEGKYLVNETTIAFTEEEILEELKNHPERFSPNAIMRPLFQEVVLPNLCYVGGGGELAYWFELKDYLEELEVVFPSLLMRNSALLIPKKQEKKINKLGLKHEDLFLSQDDLKTKHTKRISEIAIDFSSQKQLLEQEFKDLYDLAEKTDKSFLGAVAAQEQKQKNGLDHLEKRLLKAQKRKLKDELDRICDLQNELFPHGNLQERTYNFSVFYQVYGRGLIQQLFKELNPLSMAFNIITI